MAMQPPSPMVLVLVDDDLVMHQLVARTLMRTARREITILHAYRPSEAITVIEALPQVALAVLSDLEMNARRDGVELLREIKRMRPDAMLFLYSSRPRAVLEEMTRGDGVSEIFEKPIDVERFTEAFWERAASWNV